MPRLAGLFLLTFAVFLAVDLLWLAGVAQSFYHEQLRGLLAPSPDWPAAILFYLIYIGGLLGFVILPGLQGAGRRHRAWRAAAFGLVTYSTYELTNKALIRDWPGLLVPVDIAWGIVLCLAVSSLVWFLAPKLGLAEPD